MGAALKLFLFVLGNYSAEQIVSALAAHARYSTEFPAPAEIVQIIERGNRPPLDKVAYLALCRKRDADRFLTEDDKRYIQDYEHWAVHGVMPTRRK